MQSVSVAGLADWRRAARRLIGQGVSPADVVFTAQGQDGLFAPLSDEGPPPTFRVPADFLALAEDVSMHRSPTRWALLYRTLYRLVHGERHLLEIIVDPDVRELSLLQKAVRRDIHKMHAFVRFRKVEGAEPEQFIAWHRPDHLIVERVGPWFAKRFGAMHWAILTPDQSVYWDTSELRYGPGVPRTAAPPDDQLEDLWRAYYACIFNPARVKVKAMKTEMPVRHWATLPETQLIPGLLAQARGREETMREETSPSAAPFVPDDRSYASQRRAIQGCEGCELHRKATQAVFGEGPHPARVMFVGEQPGDQEDLEGRPFLGPAGQLWNQALAEAGLRREEVYVTNSVKHFKFEERGKRRIHQKPRASHVAACRPWLEAEFELVQPALIVALGATAALAIAGREMTIARERGKVIVLPNGQRLLVTVHPSFLLRLPDEAERARQYRQIVEDLRIAAEWLNGAPEPDSPASTSSSDTGSHQP